MCVRVVIESLPTDLGSGEGGGETWKVAALTRCRRWRKGHRTTQPAPCDAQHGGGQRRTMSGCDCPGLMRHAGSIGRSNSREHADQSVCVSVAGKVECQSVPDCRPSATPGRSLDALILAWEWWETVAKRGLFPAVLLQRKYGNKPMPFLQI